MKNLLFAPLVSAALAGCYQSEGHRQDGRDTDGPVCGNGIVDPGEVCDDWNDDNTDTCTNACQLNVCGDGFLYTGVEQCDDGNEDDGDECTGLCRLPACMDGLLQAGEACDDGNEDDCDGCTSLCRWERAMQTAISPGAISSEPIWSRRSGQGPVWAARIWTGVISGDLEDAAGHTFHDECWDPSVQETVSAPRALSGRADPGPWTRIRPPGQGIISRSPLCPSSA